MVVSSLLVRNSVVACGFLPLVNFTDVILNIDTTLQDTRVIGNK